MKIMTYNILDGGKDRLPLIIDIIKTESPDYLTINEANGFEEKDTKILKDFAKQINLPYYRLALSGEQDYHVAIFSKFPFKEITIIKHLMRACIVALVETPLGLVSLASMHLAPVSEDRRLTEIERILDTQKKYKNCILMGDMNSLSKNDNYDKHIVHTFNDGQLKKFTTDRKLRFDVISKIKSFNNYDCAEQMKKHKEHTVPTDSNIDVSHSNMRLDYILISEALLPHLLTYGVIKNENTDKASDHYPIIVELV